MKQPDADFLHGIAPHFRGVRAVRQATIINAIGPVLASTLKDYDITVGLRAAHFLAQICHESDGFCTTIEYASGQAYEHRKDLGNTKPGDGVRYKGRGLIQLTGRSNYEFYGAALELDMITNPGIAADPLTSLLIACEFWKAHGLNVPADRDDIISITRRINGKLNGLADRQVRLRRAKEVLGLITTPDIGHVARHDHRNEVIRNIQVALIRRGYGIKADGRWGAMTAAAVRRFQRSRGLPCDGIVGTMTRMALEERL